MDSEIPTLVIPDKLLAFAEAEAVLVRAAARNSSAEQRKELFALGALLMQCAKVGDIDQNLLTDRKIEQQIGRAAGMPEEAQAHAESKAEFKLAWRTCHALRDAVPAVQMRVDQIRCIVEGDADGAAEIAHAFFASVGKAL
jgi:DNA-binding GntR family transcriptional regulator